MDLRYNNSDWNSEDMGQSGGYIPTQGNYQTSILKSPVNIPNNPSTPAPKSINNIQTDARERFAGIVWMQKDSSHTLEDYFIDYDNWESYSETKSYSKRTYQAAYKGRMREYHNYLCILNSDEGEEYYVVAKRVRSELEQLEPYCTCIKCISSNLNPMKYIWCNYCTHCIKAGVGFAKGEYIIKAKQLKDEEDKRKTTVSASKYTKYLSQISYVKTAELLAACVLFVISLWLRSY